MQSKSLLKRRSVRTLYKYVWLGVGLWISFIATFGVAYVRVSQHEKFQDLPFKSLSEQQTQKPAESY